jgi:hypothetical protein
MLLWNSGIENIPSKTCKLSNTGSRACKRLADQGMSKGMCRSHHCTSNDKTGCSKNRNIPLAEQVLKISNEWTNRRNGKRISDWKPTNGLYTKIHGDVRQCASGEVEKDL